MKFWVEVIALAVAAGAMIFSGIQTMILVRTVDAPYKSNLQDRQINACAALIEAYSAYAGRARWAWDDFRQLDLALSMQPGLERTTSPDAEEHSDDGANQESQKAGGVSTGVRELFENPFVASKAVGFSTADYRAQVLAQIGPLSVYASEETNEVLDQLRSALLQDGVQDFRRTRELAAQLLAGDYELAKSLDELPDKPSQSAFSAIEGRCRDVMLGEEVGFL